MNSPVVKKILCDGLVEAYARIGRDIVSHPEFALVKAEMQDKLVSRLTELDDIYIEGTKEIIDWFMGELSE